MVFSYIFLSNVNETDDLQQIGPGEVLRSDLKVQVISVYDRHAVGEIISGPKHKSFEEAFNDLINQIDTENGEEEVKFGGETFRKEEAVLLLKLQSALYHYRNNLEKKENEDGNCPVINGDNEASDLEKNDV